ncbi:flippase [uncultured Methanobacterium sp.]|uniref:flippase n=1 Tax=uncultured Methanobacterium sp. TaxID=176306 RepID=UPI002AA65975|nr:flippase [uncultured Methanobacterium sp.]
MLNYIKKILSNEDYKRIIDNIISLLGLQGFNYILPLITFPYLTRVLGPDKYGLLAFALAFIGYFQILTDYGFNWSATREISINRSDDEKVSEIYSSVMTTKAILMVLSFLLMMVVVFSFEKFRSDWILYFFTFGLVVGNLLLPTWFFQGMERMRYISILNICIGLIYTISIFIFVRNSSDYLYVPIINTMGTLIIGIYSLRIVRKEFDITFLRPSLNDIKYQLKEGWHVFLSTAAISLYTISNTFILGFFASNTVVGYYSVADRVIKMVSGLLGPISQSIYPYISSLAIKSRQDTINFLKKTTILIGTFSFIISTILFLFGGFIIYILAGPEFNESVILIQIMAFLPFIIALSNIFGIQTMLPFNYKKAFSKIIIIAGVINIILALILSPVFKALGVSVAVVITEIFVTIVMYYYLKVKGIDLLEF